MKKKRRWNQFNVVKMNTELTTNFYATSKFFKFSTYSKTVEKKNDKKYTLFLVNLLTG